MNAKHFLLSCALCACSTGVWAQWQWVDESGRNVFSDRPPPPHIPSGKILQRPPGSLPQPAPKQLVVTALDAPAAATPDTPPATGAAPQQPPALSPEQLEAEKAAQAAEAAEKAAAEAKRLAEEAERKKQAAQQAKARQENCARARAAQNTLQPGMRVATINEQGERGFMSDAQRQRELGKAMSIIQDNC